MANSNIDYSNLKNITKELKKNLAEKYSTLERIASEVNNAAITQSGGGPSNTGLGEMGDLLDIFFSQNTYNGTLKINGGLIVDYIDSAEGASAGETNIAEVKKLINRAIDFNNKKFNVGAQSGLLSSIGTLAGANIISSSIRNSTFSGGLIDGAELQNVEGLNNLFRDDYLEMYSITSVRDNFIFFVSSAYNDISFSYDERDKDFFKVSFGQKNDIITGNSFPPQLSAIGIDNTYMESKL